MKNKIALLILFVSLFIFNLNFASSVITNTTMLNDSFENGNFNLWTDNGATDWTLGTTRAVSPTHSAEAGSASNDLLSDDMDMSDASHIFISFSYWVTAIDNNDDVILYYWDGTAYDSIIELGTQTAGQWNSFSATITDSQYFDNGFHVYIEGSSIDAGETLQVDDVLIVKQSNSNVAPTIMNISASHSTIKGGNTISIYANTSEHWVNDSNVDTLNLYCDTTNTPTAVNTDCTGGTTSDVDYPYILTCTFATPLTDTSNVEYCRVYDGNAYSSNVPNITYTTDSTPPTTSVVSVAGDTSASYYDIVNDALTEIIISGETSMACKWGTTDVAYGSMSNTCSVSGTTANCSINDVSSQGLTTRYVACADSLGNAQNSSQNLNVAFYLDYTAPTTTDNSNILVHAPNYTVTITEIDNVDSDPTSYYCTSSTAGCTPLTSIDNGGTITYTSANRGVNYLRYYSTDDAGNTQTNVNKTININQFPLLTSASDDAIIIKGGANVNVSVISSDADSGQLLNLFVCSSSGATSSGCTGTEYCSASGASNLSCVFISETDSASHNWYAYIFDDSDEAASANPLTGSYTTDSTGPGITLSSPLNQTYSQSSISATIVLNEFGNWAGYSLDNSANVSLANISAYAWTGVLSLADGQHNITFYANDSYGNMAETNTTFFVIDTTVPDTTAPGITIWIPVNSSYYSYSNILFNITADENISWAGYVVDLGSLTDLSNVSITNWNASVSLADGQHNITFYANDSSNNQASSAIFIYVDLSNPQVITFNCGDANGSQNVNCNYSISDSLGLNYIVIGYNASGVWQNSSHLSVSGMLSEGNYIIGPGNTTPGGFESRLYVYDLSGRVNDTKTSVTIVYDDVYPGIYNLSYYPNSSADLDPGVNVRVNVTIIDDYSIADVYLMYRNSSGYWSFINMTNASAIVSGSPIIYNASLYSLGNESWEFAINVSDMQGNNNISSSIFLDVAVDSSYYNSTTIPNIKSLVYAERLDNNSLGEIFINNTGDNSLNFTIMVHALSDIISRFNLNYTFDNNASYEINPNGNINISLLVNTTSLPSGLYDYNITINSSLGQILLEKKLNIQTSQGAYLVTTINTYSSSVTKGQTGIEFSSTLTNLGTQEATGVILAWILPSEFTLTSGSLSRSLGNIPIGGTGTNSIVISVSSSSLDKYVNVSALATATNADSSNDFKQIAIGSPITVTQNIASEVGGGAAGFASGGGGVATPVYSKSIEVVRGQEDRFNIEVYNKYFNSTIGELTLNLTGFLAKYIRVIPSKINSISPRGSANFTIILTIPEYSEYNEQDLKAFISGYKLDGTNSKVGYYETQNIKLVIQEVSKEDTSISLIDAEKAIEEMGLSGFNSVEVSKLLEEARGKLKQGNNKEAKIIAEKIISIRDKALEANDLIDRVSRALDNPELTGLITGNVAREVTDENEDVVSTGGVLTGKVIFDSKSAEEVLALAKAAFDRGDYDSAYERAKSAQVLLLLDRKGNIGLFLYLYWQYFVLGVIVISLLAFWISKQYKQVTITRRINESDTEEENIRVLIQALQRNYYSGKLSSHEYHSAMSQYHDEIARIRKTRTALRNTRLKTISVEQISHDLKNERLQTEQEMKKLQERFYIDKKISENEYKTQLEMLNQRLAEMEDEETTSLLMNKHKHEFGKNNKANVNNVAKVIVVDKADNSGEVIKDENKVNSGNYSVPRPTSSNKQVIKKEEGKNIIKESFLTKFFGSPVKHIKKKIEQKKMKDEEYIKDKIKKMGIK